MQVKTLSAIPSCGSHSLTRASSSFPLSHEASASVLFFFAKDLSSTWLFTKQGCYNPALPSLALSSRPPRPPPLLNVPGM